MIILVCVTPSGFLAFLTYFYNNFTLSGFIPCHTSFFLLPASTFLLLSSFSPLPTSDFQLLSSVFVLPSSVFVLPSFVSPLRGSLPFPTFFYNNFTLSGFIPCHTSFL